MGAKPYKTLLKRGADELVINKSRFICYGAPAETEEEALAFLASVRSSHKDASHNCYAYAIGANMGIMRYSDDGEPGGTAGMPIMEVIKAKEITNCILVITRYFGGILLGAGGLVRAYSQGAALAVNACGVGTVYPSVRYMLELPYPLLGRCEYLLKSLPVRQEDKAFTDKVTLTLLMRTADEEHVLNELVTGLDGRPELLKIEDLFEPWTE